MRQRIDEEQEEEEEGESVQGSEVRSRISNSYKSYKSGFTVDSAGLSDRKIDKFRKMIFDIKKKKGKKIL